MNVPSEQKARGISLSLTNSFQILASHVVAKAGSLLTYRDSDSAVKGDNKAKDKHNNE